MTIQNCDITDAELVKELLRSDKPMPEFEGNQIKFPAAYYTPLEAQLAVEICRLHELNVDKTEIIDSLCQNNAELLAALKAALPFMENAEEREDFEFGEWRRVSKIAADGDLSPEIVQVRAAIAKAEEVK